MANNKSIVRILTQDDWSYWREIRLEAVKFHPEAFSASYEDESQYADDMFKQGLAKNTIFGAYSNDTLVGVAGFLVLPSRKMKHRGNLFSMYVKKEYRGYGIADQLVGAVIAHARTRVLQLHCTVVTGNNSAIKLYQKFGFKIYGTEPRSLSVNSQYYDEYLMVRIFDDHDI